MKKLILTLSLAIASYFSYAQTNVLNSTGWAGVGTLTPTQLLEVNGGYSLLNGLRINGADNANSIYSNSDIGITTNGGAAGLHILQNGNQYFMGGNIGIGTATPPAIGNYGVFAINGRSPSQGGYLSMMMNGSEVGSIVANSQFNIGTASGIATQFYTGSAPTMRIASNGNVGIGTTSPTAARLVLNSAVTNQNALINGDKIGFTRTSDAAEVAYFKKTTDLGVSGTANIHGYDGIIFRATGAEVAKMAILSNGNVGIGTTSPDTKLTVNGTIHSTEVKVESTVPTPDYVFEPDYKLTSLDELKAYVDKNHHLPEIPSAKEMEKNGIQLGDMNMKLLKKVEELTLYLIEQSKQLTNQEKINQSLQKQIDQLVNTK